jgi:hypothetical protein
MKRYRGKALVGVVVVLVLLFAPVGAAQSDEIVLGSHYGFSGTISKIESGMLFIKTDSSLQPRAISPNKADRVGLYNAKVGDSVNILVDSGNVLIDASSTDRGYPDHVFVVGTVHYSDPYWHEIQLSTPEGTTTYEVDSLAGTKLSGFADGAPATLELDADNVMIDIQHGRSR